MAPPVGRSAQLRNLKTSELVAQAIVNHIIDAGLDEGDLLESEREMVETYQVGRTTLREALRLLEARGVVRIRPGPRGGPVVRRPRAEDLQEPLTLLLRFSGGSLLDVLDARSAIEPMSARMAAERIDDDMLARLTATVDAMRADLDDQSVFAEQNQRFHSLVAEATGSSVLGIFTDSLRAIGDGVFAGVEYTARRRGAVADAHDRIIESLRRHDGDGAATAMSAHLDDARGYWQQRYGDLVSQRIQWVQ